jgi:PAS domain S-box-containing protein
MRDDEARLVVDSMPGLAWSASADGTLVLVNSRLRDFTGRTTLEREHHGSGPSFWWTQVLHADDVEPWAAAWSRAMESGGPWEIDHRMRRSDDTSRWFRVSVQPQRDRDGQVHRWYGVSLDIDDGKRAEEALSAAEECVRKREQILDALPVIVWSASPEGEPSYQNHRAMHYSGVSLAEFKLKWQDRFVHPDDVAMVSRAWARARISERPFDVVSRHRGADGSFRWFHTLAEPLRDDAGRILQWFGVDVDVDERRIAEETLRSTQVKLSRASEIAMVAELAASIAHEISQPLAAVVANAHASHRWMSAIPPNLERAKLTAERIIRDGSAAAEVVSRIRALFKRSDSNRALLDMNEVIGEVVKLMADEASSRNVGIVVDLVDDLPPTLADRVQVQQVIANLARNGVDAMDASDATSKVLSIRSRSDGPGTLLIEISDEGSGLEDVESVFEPFFTTKEKGMGMGLAISRWIVEAHQGRLWATRNSTRGATFAFTLPTVSRDAS